MAIVFVDKPDKRNKRPIQIWNELETYLEKVSHKKIIKHLKYEHQDDIFGFRKAKNTHKASMEIGGILNKDERKKDKSSVMVMEYSRVYNFMDMMIY